MKKTAIAQGKEGKSISIGGNSEFVEGSTNVFNAKGIKAGRDVYILKDSFIIGEHFQSASRGDTLQGSAVQFLGQQTRSLLATLGYHHEGYDARTENCFEWIINIPARRRRYDRILVRAVEGEAGISNVAALRQATKREKTDEGWDSSRPPDKSSHPQRSRKEGQSKNALLYL